jgi:glycosidase
MGGDVLNALSKEKPVPKSIWDTEIQEALDEARRRPQENRRGLADRPLPFPSPADWRDHWIYFILLDRFANPAAPPRHAWDGAHNAFQGGTLNGVRNRLDYLKDLGVGAIWLSPVQKNCQYQESYHGYGIQDFVAIDPRLASDPEAARQDPTLVEDELRGLVDAAHARGIYVIFDIVLNHTGDVFEYVLDDGSTTGMAPWRNHPYAIRWRDANGRGNPAWSDAPANPSADAALWPEELRRNEFMRRQGNAFSRPASEQEIGGDFFTLKELVTDYPKNAGVNSPERPVMTALIRAYQYLLAKYDVDGFRIDTLKYVEREAAQVFGNAIREYALALGKKNFFTFGEIYDDEEKIARFVGRNALDPGDLTGVDAALDFPLFYQLPGVIKGMRPPAAISHVFQRRREILRGLISSHGEVGRYFVSFLDNHDQHQRFYYSDPTDPHAYDHQLTMAVACLFALQGIPCLYYGTEQGLHGSGDSPEAVREALWGKPNAFDPTHPFYQAISEVATVRNEQPALRYGRQYFRPVSGNGFHFGMSTHSPGVLAFSRILSDDEVVVVANTDPHLPWQGEVLVDLELNPPGAAYTPLYSNRRTAQDAPTGPVVAKPDGGAEIHHPDGSVSFGPLRSLPINLLPGEIIIARRTWVEHSGQPPMR